MPSQRSTKDALPSDTTASPAQSKRVLGSKSSRQSGVQHQALLIVQGSTALVGWQVVACTGRPTPQEQLMHHTRRVYDRNLLGFCYVVDSLSVSLSYKATTTTSITQPWLALQLFVPHDSKKLSIELCLTDVMRSNNTRNVSKRRIFLSTAIKEAKSTPLHASLPLESVLLREEWTTLLLDLNAIVSSAYRHCRFRSLEGISIQGDKLKLRNIYTLRSVSAASTDEAQSTSSRSSTSLSLSTVSSSGDPPDFCPETTSASRLDSVAPRQLAYPFTMTATTSWVVIRGGPESCHHLRSPAAPESEWRPGQLKKADSGLSISLSPSASLTSLASPCAYNSSLADHNIHHHQQSTGRSEPLDCSNQSQSAPSAPSLVSMVDRVRRRKAALERINENNTTGVQPLQQPRQQVPLTSCLDSFPSAIPRPAGVFTGRGPILAPIGRPPPQVKVRSFCVATGPERKVDSDDGIDPYDLEVQQTVERAMRKVKIHNGESIPSMSASMLPEVHNFESAEDVGNEKVVPREDSGAKCHSPKDVVDGAPTSVLALMEPSTGLVDSATDRMMADDGNDEDSVELVYDAAVGAYFDPESNKYFTLQD